MSLCYNHSVTKKKNLLHSRQVSCFFWLLQIFLSLRQPCHVPNEQYLSVLLWLERRVLLWLQYLRVLLCLCLVISEAACGLRSVARRPFHSSFHWH